LPIHLKRLHDQKLGVQGSYRNKRKTENPQAVTRVGPQLSVIIAPNPSFEIQKFNPGLKLLSRTYLQVDVGLSLSGEAGAGDGLNLWIASLRR
jgi:hypothetical protein